MEEIVLNFRRELNFCRDKEVLKGEFSIFKLVFLAEQNEWACHWRISYISPQTKEYPRGEDPLQALTRTLQAASALLQASTKIKVWWKTEGDNGGLPLMPLDREMIRRCFHCKGRNVVAGEVHNPEKLTSAVFLPNGLGLTRPMFGGPELQRRAFACLDCGTVWTQTEPDKVKSLLRRAKEHRDRAMNMKI